MAAEDAVELLRVVERAADGVAVGALRRELVQVPLHGIEAFLEHAMIAVEQIDRAHQARKHLLELREMWSSSI